MKVTFKVHKVEQRGFVDGVPRQERVTMHPIDPHEEGVNDLANVTRSGEGKIVVNIYKPEALGKFKQGALVNVTFET